MTIFSAASNLALLPSDRSSSRSVSWNQIRSSGESARPASLMASRRSSTVSSAARTSGSCVASVSMAQPSSASLLRFSSHSWILPAVTLLPSPESTSMIFCTAGPGCPRASSIKGHRVAAASAAYVDVTPVPFRRRPKSRNAAGSRPFQSSTGVAIVALHQEIGPWVSRRQCGTTTPSSATVTEPA